MIEQLIISAFSGIAPYLIGLLILAIVWAVRTHMKARETDKELCRKVDALEKWQEKHDSDTGSIHEDMADLKLETSNRLTAIETKLDIIIKNGNGH